METSSKVLKTGIRPSERVLRFLETGAFSNESSKSEVRLPSMREVAKHLNVSVSTVVAVYRELSSTGRIRTEIGNGSFLLPRSGQPSREPRGLRLAINLKPSLLTDAEGWHYRVFSGITMAALESGDPVTIQPIGDTPFEKLSEVMADFDILLICAGGAYWSAMVEKQGGLGFPILFLNPPYASATENFVAPDFYGASKLLGQAFLENHRKQVLFMMNGPIHLITSSHWRVMGLLSGYQLGGDRGRNFHMEFTEGATSPEGGRLLLRRFIREKGFHPDAIYCSGDYLALGCIEELEAEGLHCPRDVSVIGGSGLNLALYGQPNLTRARQPFEQVGREVIAMVRAKIAEPERVFPGKIVPMGWMGGCTSSEQENTILFPRGVVGKSGGETIQANPKLLS